MTTAGNWEAQVEAYLRERYERFLLPSKRLIDVAIFPRSFFTGRKTKHLRGEAFFLGDDKTEELWFIPRRDLGPNMYDICSRSGGAFPDTDAVLQCVGPSGNRFRLEVYSITNHHHVSSRQDDFPSVSRGVAVMQALPPHEDSYVSTTF